MEAAQIELALSRKRGPMTNLEFCKSRRKAELPAFVRVLKALPQARLDYRPDPKARTAGDLAWLLAAEEASLLPLIDTGTIDWKEQKAPASVDEIGCQCPVHERIVGVGTVSNADLHRAPTVAPCTSRPVDEPARGLGSGAVWLHDRATDDR